MTPVNDDESTAREVELACRYDDPSDPSELTVYSPEPPNCATEWLTVDRSVAVSLDRIR